jgi:hypothetical protein
MFLNDFELRTIVALGLQLAATKRVPVGDGAFESYVQQLAADATTALRKQGLRAIPPYPGSEFARSSASVQKPRVAFRAELWRDEEHLGTIITALIGGRIPNISVAPPAGSVVIQSASPPKEHLE